MRTDYGETTKYSKIGPSPNIVDVAGRSDNAGKAFPSKRVGPKAVGLLLKMYDCSKACLTCTLGVHASAALQLETEKRHEPL